MDRQGLKRCGTSPLLRGGAALRGPGPGITGLGSPLPGGFSPSPRGLQPSSTIRPPQGLTVAACDPHGVRRLRRRWIQGIWLGPVSTCATQRADVLTTDTQRGLTIPRPLGGVEVDNRPSVPPSQTPVFGYPPEACCVEAQVLADQAWRSTSTPPAAPSLGKPS